MTIRLFAAAWPSTSLMERLRQIERPIRPGLRWTTEDQWHVTLRFYGSVDPDELPTLIRSLADVAARVPPLPATSGPRAVVLSPHVWVLPVEGLAPLAAEIGTGEGRPFRGHITLARAKRRGGFDGLVAPELVDRWEVDEFCLVKSELHAAGARYHVVDRWRLTSR